MPQFRRVVLPERSCDSLTGPGETTSEERPVAAGPLQTIPSVSPTKGRENTTNVSSCSYRLRLGEERLQTQVSTGDISSA